MLKSRHFVIAGVLALLSLSLCASQAIADSPSYMPVDSGYTNYHTGYAEVYNSTEGTSYGKAKIEWNCWFNQSDDYWYYAYKVYNNESGAAGDRTDDYHFGHVYNSGSADSINTFNIVMPVQIPQITGDELLVVSALAGSDAGGSAWDPIVSETSVGGDIFITGVNWSAGGSGSTIRPTQWSWQKIGQTWKWVEDYAGDASRGDSGNFQYFEIASKWAPGLITANVSNGLVTSDTTALGSVYGPAVVPEPATCLLFGFGLLGLSSYRRKIR